MVTSSIDVRDNVFFTDNGSELRLRYSQERKREASYYPMQTTALLRDNENQFTVNELTVTFVFE